MKVLLIIVGYLLVACLVWIAHYIDAIKKYKKEEEEKYGGTHYTSFEDWDNFCIDRVAISILWIIIWIPYLFYKGMCLVKNYIDKKYEIN
jgi:hypothetical protein